MTTPPQAVNAQAPDSDFEFAALDAAINYRRSLLEEFSPYLLGNVLEIGAGVGQFTQELIGLPNIGKLCALEPDERFYERLARQGLNAECIHGTIETIEPLPAYDAEVCINVLEHIEDHFDELKRYKARLKPGGNLCLFVPAGPSIYAPIDRSFGHFRRYTRPELQTLLEEAGFRVVKLYYYNCVGFFAWWLNFCVLKKMTFEVNKVKTFDSYIFPAVYNFEKRIMRPPFGQSLVAVAQA
jgi:SAM-dependent methyltransferase